MQKFFCRVIPSAWCRNLSRHLYVCAVCVLWFIGHTLRQKESDFCADLSKWIWSDNTKSSSIVLPQPRKRNWLTVNSCQGPVFCFRREKHICLQQRYHWMSRRAYECTEQNAMPLTALHYLLVPCNIYLDRGSFLPSDSSEIQLLSSACSQSQFAEHCFN